MSEVWIVNASPVIVLAKAGHLPLLIGSPYSFIVRSRSERTTLPRLTRFVHCLQCTEFTATAATPAPILL